MIEKIWFKYLSVTSINWLWTSNVFKFISNKCMNVLVKIFLPFIIQKRRASVTVGGCNLCGRAINYVGVFCRERDVHTLARIVALTTTIAQLRLKLKIQVTL